jgi:hypothetical protein
MLFSVFGFSNFLPRFLSLSVLVYRLASVKPLPLYFFVEALAVMLLRSYNCRKLLYAALSCPVLHADRSQILTAFLPHAPSITMKMSMEHWWNDTDRENPKYLVINLSYCDTVYHKSHMGGIEPSPPR